MTAEKQMNESSDEEKDYDPKKRGIGMDFLDFVRRKPAPGTTKNFMSTQKTCSEWSTGKKFEKSGKKLRPSSAQQITSKLSKFKNFEDVFSMNEDIDGQPIVPINESPEEVNTNRVSDELMVIKTLDDIAGINKDKSPSGSNNGEVSLNTKRMQPVYDDQDRSQTQRDRPNSASSLKVKKKSKSKSRKNKPSEERKQKPKNTVIDYQKYSTNGTENKKPGPVRPFSGGNERPANNPKVILKTNKKVRPKTAKISQQELDKDIKSPSRKFLSPKGSKKSISKKSTAKKVKGNRSSRKKSIGSNKNMRRTSLSPNSEGKDNLEPVNVPSVHNRRSMNDLKNHDSNSPMDILSNKIMKKAEEIIEKKLIIIQKVMKGYKVYKDISKLKSSIKSVDTKKNSSLRSDDTFARATNQAEILIEMSANKSKHKHSKDSGLTEIVEQDTPVIEETKMVIITNKHKSKKELRERPKIRENPNSKSASGVEDKEDDSDKHKELINKSLRLLKKKRPNSAKVNSSDSNDAPESVEKFAIIMDKLKAFKTQRVPNKKSKTEDDLKKSAGKPPINRVPRNDKNSYQRSGETSDRHSLSQMSPTGSNTVALTTQKYQEIVK